MRQLSISIFAAFLCLALSAQETPRLPLDLPVSFSGTYGELRHNHFHGGYDFRVGGKIGDPIHAIADGYVSRVSVSSTGYGNGLYITYNDSITVVHGHMSSFASPIAERVKKEQYDRQSFNIDITFNKNEFPVKRGEIIGKVGNTGSSGGPHLHFEFRASDGTFDYIRNGFYKLSKDNVPPVISKVAFYALVDSTVVPKSYKITQFTQRQNRNDVLLLPENSYVAIDATDRQAGTPGKLAISLYELLLDGKSVFRFELGDIAYEEDSFIQSLIEFRESYRRGNDMVKSYVEPLNILSSRHITAENCGVITLNDNEVHEVLVKVSDISDNHSEWAFNVRRGDIDMEKQICECDSIVQMCWFEPNIIETESFKYSVPASALYNSIDFIYRKICDANPADGRYSATWQLGDPSIPMNKAGILRFKSSNVPDDIKDKVFIASISPDGKIGYAGGSRDGEWLKATVKFGNYCVAVDTTSPQIRFVSYRGGASTNYRGELALYVLDDGSGVSSYRVEIDGNWILSQMKGNRITVNLSEEKIGKGSHMLQIIAEDRVGNSTKVKKNIVFK